MRKWTILIAIAGSLSACNLADQNKQIKTVVYMQSIAARVQDHFDRIKRPPSTEAAAMVNEVNGGRDAWRYPFAYYANDRSYVLVSAGSDGQFESNNPEYYFSMIPHDVHNDPRRDIVLRDGEFVARAGK